MNFFESKRAKSSSSPTLKSPPSPSSSSVSEDNIKQRLDTISVYRLGTQFPNERPISMISDVEKSEAVFYFFSESDGQPYASAVNTLEHNRKRGVKLINVPLSEIIEAEGTFCTNLVPDMSQIKNAQKSDALKVMGDGTPNKLQPVFFRKEDLEKALAEEKQMKRTDVPSIQVTALEDMIQQIKGCSSTSMWDDVVFMPPQNDKL